ncbi:MAG: hypothetical protein ACXWIU_12105, partial [Limisphaerales bacterium]
MNLKKSTLLAAIVLVAFVLFRSGSTKVSHIAQAPAKSIPESAKQSASAPSVAKASPTGASDLREWISKMQAANAMPSAQSLIEAKRLASEHADNIRQLMRENPSEAFARSLSWAEWLALTENIRPLVEKPFSEKVDFQVLPSCPPIGEAVNKVHPYRVSFEGESHDAFVYGSTATMTSKEELPARGFLLDGQVVLGDEPFEKLQGDNLNAALQLYPRGAPKGVSYLSGQPIGADGESILLGGKIYELASQAEESELADVLSTAAKSFNPKSIVMALAAGTAASGTIAFSVDAAKKEVLTANSTWTETSKRVLAVRLSYSSAPTSYSFTMTQLTNLLVASSNNVKTMSYRKTWLVPSYATVDLPNNQAYYEAAGNGPNAIVADTAAGLTAQGINTANYDIIVHAHPQSGGGNFGYAGLGVIGGGTTWVNGTVDANVLTHEIGHNYGLGHAHFWAGLTGMGGLGRTGNDGAQVEQEEYGDPYDVMGGGGLPAAHYGAHGKLALNWIEPQEVITVVTNGIYRIYRFDHVDARTNTGTKLALKIVCPGGEEYWVSHRKLFTANASMLRGAYLVRANGAGDQGLIDTTPISRPNATFGTDRDDAALA